MCHPFPKIASFCSTSLSRVSPTVHIVAYVHATAQIKICCLLRCYLLLSHAARTWGFLSGCTLSWAIGAPVTSMYLDLSSLARHHQCTAFRLHPFPRLHRRRPTTVFGRHKFLVFFPKANSQQRSLPHLQDCHIYATRLNVWICKQVHQPPLPGPCIGMLRVCQPHRSEIRQRRSHCHGPDWSEPYPAHRSVWPTDFSEPAAHSKLRQQPTSDDKKALPSLRTESTTMRSCE